MIQKLFTKITDARTDHERAASFIKPGDTILDYGCGDCSFFDELRKKVPNLTCIGIEIDQRKIEISQKKGYIVADDEQQLITAKRKVDWIILNEVVEHLYKEDLRKLFQTSRKLLKPTGKIMISTPNAHDIFSLAGFWDASDHVRPYTPVAIAEAASLYGFAITKTIRHHLRIHPGKLLFCLCTNTSPFAGITVILEQRQ